jgi:O-antigen ligase
MSSRAADRRRAPPPESRLFSYARGLLAVTAACLPLYVVRWQVGPVPTTLLENLVLATIALYVIAMWQAGRLRLHRSPIDIPILLLLLSGVISVIVAKDHRAALGLYKAYFIEPIALFYVAIDLIRGPSDYRRLLVGLGIGTSAFAALNIANFAIAFAENQIAFGSPPTALYQSANEVAMFLEPPLAFAAALVLFSERRLDRLLGVVWTLFVGMALIFTLSRGAFLALAMFAVFVILTLNPAFRKPALAVVGVFAAGAVAILALGSHTPVVVHRLSLKALEYTSVTRFEIYWETLRMLLPHPIFGLGLGGFLLVYHEFPEIYPHDIWLTFWVEVGLLGLVAFGIIFFRLFNAGWRALPLASGFDRIVLWGGVGALVLWGVHGIFDSPYWKNDMSVEFWLVAAMLVTASAAIKQHAALSAPTGGIGAPAA